MQVHNMGHNLAQGHMAPHECIMHAWSVGLDADFIAFRFAWTLLLLLVASFVQACDFN